MCMNIAYFHTNTILSSWTIWNGAKILRSLGHRVWDAAIPTDVNGAVVNQISQDDFAHCRRQLPSREQLQAFDVLIVAGPEYIDHWLDALYGNNWPSLVPNRIGLFLESTQRTGFERRIERTKNNYTHCYYPDLNDAARFAGHWHRPHIDTEKFRPAPEHQKKYGAAFVGSLYQSRIELLQQVQQYLPEQIRAAFVCCHDLAGECHALWTGLYRRDIWEMRVHIGLPSNNPMPVSRPFETLACGTFLLESTTLPEPLQRDVHYVSYHPYDARGLAELIKYYLAHESEREEIARAGCKLVREEFSSRRFWQDLLKFSV